MAYKKLISLILFTLIPLASCQGKIESNNPSDETADSSDTMSYETTADNVLNYFEKMKEGKNGSIRYSITDENGDITNETDVFTPTYYALGGNLKQGEVLLPSYDEEETQSSNLVYNYTYDDDGNVSLSNAAYIVSGDSYDFKTSFDSNDNLISLLGSRATKNAFKYDEDNDMVYSISLTLIRALAQAVQYPYYSGIQSGARAIFYFTADNELNFYIEGTYKDTTTGESGDVQLSEAYIFDVGDSELATDQLNASLLDNKLTADQLSTVYAKPSEFSTVINDVTVKVNYGTEGKMKVTQSMDGRDDSMYFQENPSDGNKVYQYLLTAQDTIASSKVIDAPWDQSLYYPEGVFNPNAFVLSSDGLYHYIGMLPVIDNIFVSYFFFPASQLGAFAGALGLSVNKTTNKVDKISTVLAVVNEQGTAVTGTQTLETEISTNPQDVTIPTTFNTTDDAVKNGLAKGLDKLKMNNDVLIKSSTSNVTGTTDNITATYYIDKNNKLVYKEQKVNDEVRFSKGWKETDKKTDNGQAVVAFTPFRITSDNSLKTLNQDYEGQGGVVENFINSLSTNIFKLKDGTTDTYVLKGFEIYNVASSFIFGPQGAYMDPKTLEFHTLADGTIDKVSYNYSYTTSTASGTAVIKGTETLTFTYDTDIKDKYFKADFSKDLPAFVTPTTWAEQNADIEKNIESFFSQYIGSATLAANLPYIFDRNFVESWDSLISTSSAPTLGIFTTASTSANADAFIQKYENALSSKSFALQGQMTDGTIVYPDPTSTYYVGIVNNQGAVYIIVQPYQGN